MSMLLRVYIGGVKISPTKPRLIKSPEQHGVGWFCGATDGSGSYRAARGMSPTEAYNNFQAYVSELERLGLRWEVFP